MNFHSPAQPYFRQRANANIFQQLSNQRVCPPWSDRNLLISLGKMLLVFCPILLALHLWMASVMNHLQESVQAGENSRQELMENQLSLTVRMEQMLLPERVRVIAAEKLALHVPEKEQVILMR